MYTINETRSTIFDPRYIFRAFLYLASRRIKLSVRKSDIERILFGSKTARMVAATIQRIINPPKVVKPSFVPVTFMIRYEIV